MSGPAGESPTTFQFPGQMAIFLLLLLVLGAEEQGQALAMAERSWVTYQADSPYTKAVPHYDLSGCLPKFACRPLGFTEKPARNAFRNVRLVGATKPKDRQVALLPWWGPEPSVKYDDGCTTKEEGTNNAGLWLFTREPKASKATLDAMHQLLKSKGVATSRLHTVAHEGCEYHGAVLK